MNKFNPAHPVPCVFLKHGAYWHVKRNRWTRIGATLEEALQWYARNATPAAGDGTLPAMLEKAFAHHLRVVKLAPTTLAQYRGALDVLKRRVRLFNPDQLKPKHVAQLKGDGVETPNMANRRLSLLRTLYGYLLEWGEADSNPCIGVRRLPEARRDRYVTDGEFAAIRAQAGERLRVIMDLQYLTGQRIDDVLKLRRDQLTPAGIEFKPSKTRRSTGAAVCIRWTDDLRIAVARALELHGDAPSEWVLPSRKPGLPPDYRSVHLQFAKAAEAAGVKDVRPNDQRAKAATDTDAQGRSATALLAHADPQMTKRYLRLFKAVVAEGPGRAVGEQS